MVRMGMGKKNPGNRLVSIQGFGYRRGLAVRSIQGPPGVKQQAFTGGSLNLQAIAAYFIRRPMYANGHTHLFANPLFRLMPFNPEIVFEGL
jgi:hypothetical protein